MDNAVYSSSEITDFKTKSEHFFPLAWYKKMLEEHPVYYHAGTDTWNVFKYEDVKRVLTDYALFSSVRQRTLVSAGSGTEEGTFPERLNIHDSDPPEHRKSRSLLSAAFTPRSLQAWEPRIEQVVNDLISEMEDKTEIDIVKDFTTPLPIIIMAELLGVPHKDKLLFKKWVDILFMPFHKENVEEVNQQKGKAAKEFFSYLHPFVVEKRTQLSDDIISDLIQAEFEGDKLTDEDIVKVTMFILGAGIETTSHLLANSFYSLLYDDPKLYDELRSNINLVPNFVEEMLRYRFQISKMDRTVKEDNNVLGVDLKKGDVVVAWMSAANMDKDVFDDPFTLNIHRKNNNRHQSFSNGPHICLGAPLARMEANKAFKIFIETFSHIEPVPGFDLEKNLQLAAAGQTLSSLPLKVRR
ncbi:cytochrome P450 [Paenibacillus agricola]|uniref:Cytochrome P450 n=1 Tax=Paenibacillus agricola TaxID=2716264 RepID=A0ABX0J9Y4_9BACL|nr:cytochrome P450 [Paenibacillus agricola]NHN32753.1 cytochrome P450 [Paenibacillus agricola]